MRRRGPEALARGWLAGDHPDLVEDVGAQVRRERQCEVGEARGEMGGSLAEGQGRGEHKAVQPLVAEHGRVVVDHSRQDAPARGARQAADLEHVAKIGGELQAQGQLRLRLAEIAQPQPLVEAILPDQPASFDMDHPLPGRLAANRGQRPIGEVGGEDDIVLADRAAQQLQRPPADAQSEARQQPRVVVEQSIAFAGDVAEGVSHNEGVALLQREQAGGRARIAGRRLRVRHHPASSRAAGRMRAFWLSR